MKTALEILRDTHEALSKPNPTDWKNFDEIMNDGTGEAVLQAMERYADQFRQPADSGQSEQFVCHCPRNEKDNCDRKEPCKECETCPYLRQTNCL